MSVERQKGKVTIVCDECGDEYEWHMPNEFTSMIETAREDGWLIEMVNEKWEHNCEHCVRHSPKFVIS